ncbi:MAG: L-threonylcarbamoyladenylate synthase [Bacteroidia bacterium]
MLLKIFPENINDRYIDRAVKLLREGGVIVIPTDTIYALACDIKRSDAFERICQIKQVKVDKANFSFICYDLSNISDFTKPFSTSVFRLMKNCLPGPFTFILNANNNVPTIFKSNKKTIGIRVPDNAITRRLVQELGNPIMVTTIPGGADITNYSTDPLEIDAHIGEKVDLVIDGGSSELEPSTIIDCTENDPFIIRQGKGKVDIM